MRIIANSLNNNVLVRLRNGDHAAFKMIFDAYVEKVFHYINGYVKNKQAAEDITQEVFKKLWEKREKLDESGNLEGLLFKICYHQVIDFYRDKKSSVIYTLLPVADTFMEQQKADERVESKQFEELYREAIKQLPSRRRKVYILSKHEGMSNKEIASKLSISVKTVENQMTSSIHFIRMFLRKAGQFLFCFLLILFCSKIF
ncbi:MAG: RNA polymerase sigma-70 factor [Agriterribacter sp.]